MKLSAPIYLLKRKAKLLSRDENIPLHEALDRIAAREGFSNWSLLAAKRSAPERSDQLFSRLKHGDLLLPRPNARWSLDFEHDQFARSCGRI